MKDLNHQFSAPQFGEQNKDAIGEWVFDDFFVDLDGSAYETEMENLSIEMVEIEKQVKKTPQKEP